MSRYALVSGDGDVEAVLSTTSMQMLEDNIPLGAIAIECHDESVMPGRVIWDGQAFVPVLPPPPSLEQLKVQVWDAVRGARDRAEWWGCSTPLGRADSDPDSQRKVAGAVQMAMIAQAAGAPFSIDWTMQDNRSVTHDAIAMITLGVAVGQHVADCHAAALAKRAAIEAATDASTLVDFDSEGGWPDAPTG